MSFETINVDLEKMWIGEFRRSQGSSKAPLGGSFVNDSEAKDVDKKIKRATEGKKQFHLPAKSTRLILLTVSEGRLFSRIACGKKDKSYQIGICQ